MLIVVSEDGLGIWLVDVVYKLIIIGIENVGWGLGKYSQELIARWDDYS